MKTPYKLITYIIQATLVSTLLIIATSPENIIQIILCILISLIFSSPIFITSLIANKTYKKAMEERPKQEDKYYNSLLLKYTPSTLGTLYYNQNLIELNLILTTINLENKKIITKENNTFKVQKETNDLANSEKEAIKYLTKQTTTLDAFKEKIEEENKKSNLFGEIIQKPKNNLKKVLIIELIFIVINIILSINGLTLKTETNPLIVIVLLLCLIIPFILVMVLPTILMNNFIQNQIIKENKTKEGFEIYQNLLALKKYYDKQKKQNPNKFYSTLLNQNPKTYTHYHTIIFKD